MNRIFWSVGCAVLLTGGIPSLFAAEVPSGAFLIGNATVGVTTVADVQKIYGKAAPVRVSREDEADVAICYSHRSSSGESFLVFESGVMGGFEQITGFRISTSAPRKGCVQTQVDIGSLTTGNGIRLGQSSENFQMNSAVEFKRSGSSLTHQAVGRRPATEEELKALRAKWPNEKQDYFDVTVTLRAKFKNDRLVDYHVQKIESY